MDFKVEKGFVGRLVKSVKCPLCQSEMIKRKVKKPMSEYKYWYGCRTFPKCKGQRFEDYFKEKYTWAEIKQSKEEDYDDLDMWCAYAEIQDCGNR